MMTLILLPALVAMIVFANTLRNDFVLDDPMALALAEQPIVSLFTHRYGLAYVTIKLERLFWSSASGFHFTNVLLHAFCSALVGVTALRLTRSLCAALLCAVLFAVHPAHVEAVASIENRKDLLAMACTATIVLLWTVRSRPIWTYAAAFLAFWVGLWAKDVATVGVLGVLLWMDLLDGRARGVRLRDGIARAAVPLLPFLTSAAVVAVISAGNPAVLFAHDSIATEFTGWGLSTYRDVIASSAAAVLDVARLLVYPARLSADWPRPTAHPVWGALLALVWVATAVAAARRAPTVSLAMAWIPLTYLPVSNIVPLTPHFVAERYLYVPSFGFCLLVGVALHAAIRRGPRTHLPRMIVISILVAAIVGMAAIRTIARNREWRDSVTLWSAALRTVPGGTGMIHGELGLALLNLGRDHEAIEHLQRAIEMQPEIADYNNNLGLALLSVNRPADAVTYLERALVRRPDDLAVHYNLGKALAQLGRREEAAVHLRRAMDEKAWANAPPWTRSALARQGASLDQFRQMIQRWLDVNAPEFAR